ncbi:hypothetical protein DF021_06445 [Burkholderia stagnalis]|uniref:Uncharacterized protein n=1 Tax=Burkholderia stagnalis TaxID=1503054 RepID=A0ABX9YTZ6_9BURK|nr:hypothetical protein DF137_27095 [Burkholderia stagnalis]RQQ63490.1 hypothetical protein DF158_06445 [Burkholderia stagnalis]RQQ67559.1 hypothetical protein DF139_20400 [Burkholderia stagnalis]RQQ76997.1 hypothetical protein DF138_26885 [Burkholderia stagnalis]RQQ84825.1 hypothetical protein DF136_26390 [Burkholderia stagnalis]
MQVQRTIVRIILITLKCRASYQNPLAPQQFHDDCKDIRPRRARAGRMLAFSTIPMTSLPTMIRAGARARRPLLRGAR